MSPYRATPNDERETSPSAADRWLRARERLASLTGTYPAPPTEHRSSTACDLHTSADGRVALLVDSSMMGVGAYAIDLASLRVRPIRFHSDASFRGPAVGIRDDGAIAVALDESTVTTIDLATDLPRVRQVRWEHELQRFDRESVAVHPTAALVAVAVGDHDVLVIQTDTGRVVQRHRSDAREGVAFTPDGRYLVASGFYETHVYGIDGEHHVMPADRLALSRDGTLLAIAWQKTSTLELLPFKGWPSRPSKHALRFTPPHYRDDRGSVQALRFSPDGRRLGVFFMAALPEWSERARTLSIIDVASRAIVDHVESPVSPPHGFDSIYGFGFDATGDRVIARTHHYRSRHRDEANGAVWLYSTAQRRHLGWLSLEPSASEDAKSIVGRTEVGFYGDLASDAPLDGVALAPPFESPAIARRLLCGDSLQLLPEHQAMLADLDERYATFSALVARGVIAPDVPLAPFVDATRGWTHLLPSIISRARTIVASGPQFGERRETIDAAAVCTAVAELAATSREAIDETFTRQVAMLAEAGAAAEQKVALEGRGVRVAIGGVIAGVLAAVAWWLVASP